MHGMPARFRDGHGGASFMDAKANFVRAARTGVRSQFDWFGKCMTAQALIEEELLPMAAQGLASQGVGPEDITKYLGIIGQRVRRCMTGSEWLVRNFRKLRAKHKPSVCSRTLVHECLLHQKANVPVHEWEEIDFNKYNVRAPFSTLPSIVEDVMNTEVFTINEHASVNLARHIMEWNNFHHLVVEDNKKNLMGVFSYRQLGDIDLEQDGETEINRFMRRAIITIEPHHSLESASAMMEKYNIHSLPVLDKGIMVGIITDFDLRNTR
jgi:CBS domain-containing protein